MAVAGPGKQGAVRVAWLPRWTERFSQVRAAASPRPLLLVAAIAVAALLQGGFFARGQIAFGALILAALLAEPVARAGWRPLRLPLAAGALLAAWFVIRGVTAGSAATGLRAAALLLALGTVALLCRRLDDAGRRIVLYGLLLLGAVVAAIGWWAVVARHEPLALPSAGLWRATSTLTYANAMAALLVPLALLSLALLSGRRRDVRLAVVSMVLLLGVALTLSRAGAASLAVGYLVLVCLRRRALLAATIAPAAGAAIAFLGVVPSMPTFPPARPAVAVAGLAAGVITTVLVLRAPRAAACLAVAVAVCLALAAPGPLARGASHVWHHRAHASSHSRSNAAGRAVTVFRQHPFDGIGPGQLTVQRTDGTGRLHVQPFVHDEYLQTLAEDGLPGGLLLLGVLGGTLLALWRSRGLTADRLVWAGALAALAAALIHAGFDFGWHIPAVPLIMAALVGLALAPAGQETGHVTERRED